MAKELPQYQRSLIQVPDAPQFQMPNLQEEIRSSQAMSSALDKLSGYAFESAKRYVTSEAEKFTVANPITQEQLDEAQRTGNNPIVDSLTGGMIWNDAVKKLYAQQAATELTNSAYKHYENVLQRVTNREITDAGQIQSELETPLKSWYGVLAQIDPEVASQFYTRRINDGNSYFKAGSKELKRQEQIDLDQLSEETFNGKVKQFRIDVENQDPTVAYQMYKANIAELTESFKDSSRSATYINAFEKEFKLSLYGKMSKDLQAQYGTEDKILKAIRKNELGVYEPVWNELLPSEQKEFQGFLRNDMAGMEVENRKMFTMVKSTADDHVKRLLNDQNAETLDAQYSFLQSAESMFTGEYKLAYQEELQKIEMVRDIRRRFGNLSLSQFEVEKSKIMDGDVPVEFKDNPQLYADYVSDYYDKMTTKKNKDLVAYSVEKYNGTLGNVDNLAIGNEVALQQEFGSQIGLTRSQPDYIPGATNVLTKTQVARLESMLESDIVGSAQRIQLATNIVNTFGNDAPAVFNAIAKKDPIFAQLGAISSEDPVSTRNTMNTILIGQNKMKTLGIKIDTYSRKTAIADKISSAFDIAPSNVQNVLSAADAYYIGAGNDVENLSSSRIENDYKEAIRAVMGGYTDNRGNKFGGFAEMNDDIVAIHDNFNANEVPKYVQNADKSDLLQAIVNPNKTLISEKGVEHSLVDLNQATLKRTGDSYMLLDANDRPFLDQSGNIIQIDLHILRDIYNNKQRFGKIDVPLSEGSMKYSTEQRRGGAQRKSPGTKKVNR